MFLVRSRIRVAAAMVILVAGILPAAQGATPPGTIYYLRLSAGGQGSMKGDGSGKVAAVSGQPSYQLHGGSRWFLQSRAVGATGPEQFVAVDEHGQTIQVTGDPTISHNGYPPVWAKNDSFFSFAAFASTDTQYIGRIFVVSVDWSTGAPVAAAPTLVYEIRCSNIDEFGQPTYGDEVNLGGHDWSPAGNQLALTRFVVGEGLVIELASYSNGSMTTQVLAHGEYPSWSPDGSHIAYNRLVMAQYQDVADIWTIRPDGTGAAQLTKYVAGKGYNGTGQYQPTWSPDGAYLAYTEQVISGNKNTFNIKRIPSNGGAVVSLTTDGASSYARWRP